MRFLSNLHSHCTWCDGVDSARDMAEAALAAGFSTFGFSCHAPAPFDPTCSGIADEGAYVSSIHLLAQEYEGRMDILCGIEQDYYTPIRRELYDYVIGSVHYLPLRDSVYNAADGDRGEVLRAKDEAYGGDGIAMARDYYSLVVANAVENKPDIIGHFDVVAKHNEQGALFDEASPAYKAVALEALDEVLRITAGYGGVIEVNTGAMARGTRTQPYPAPFLLRHMAEKGARVMISSDTHSKATVRHAFDEMAALLQACGFTQVVQVEKGRFVETRLV